MTKHKSIPQGYMTVGEVAKKMGVTVRALQYYDREGLFSPSSVSEGGRRLYDDKDIIKLHQVLSLKSLGFSLDEIKSHITSIDNPDEVAAVLTEQSNAIHSQIKMLTQLAKQIDALKAEVLQMQSVDFKKYADIIINLQMKNDAYHLIKYFDDDTLEYLHKRFDKESGLAMLNTFESICDRAAQYRRQGVTHESDQAQLLAKEFWEMITEFTGGDMNMLPQLMKIGGVATDNEEWTRKQETIIDFIQPALEVYFGRSGINPFEVKR